MSRLSIGQCATLACLLEVNAPKPGNVHRGADFADCTLNDFAASAVAIGPILERATERSLGDSVLDSVRATRDAAGANTNLGIVLLLAPLASISRGQKLRQEVVSTYLQQTSAQDAANIYQAIQIARAGGLELAEEEASHLDINAQPPKHILSGMREAASRDHIAMQYVNGFHDVFDDVVPLLCNEDLCASLVDRVVHTHVSLMHRFPDTLIYRKCGAKLSVEASARAGRVLESGDIGCTSYAEALADLDFWLRSDGNRRNPGTTADLIAAGLFVCLRDNLIDPPYN